MKKLFYSVLLLALTAPTFQSCSSDDDNNSSSSNDNEISIDGTVYSISSTGFLESFGENSDGSYDWDVELGSNDIDIYFDLNTNSENGLVEGTYTFSNTRQEFTFVDVEIEVEDSEDESYSPQQGTIMIDINGDTTRLTFNFVAQDGTEIEGEWSGSLTLDNSND